MLVFDMGRTVAVVCSLALGLAACSPVPAALPPAPTAEPVTSAATGCSSNYCPVARSPYEVSVQTSPNPMAFLRPTTVTVQISDPAGKSLNDVSVSLFAAHTEDIHEDVGPVVAEHVADTMFRGQLILRKKGNYSIIASVHGPSGEGDHTFHLDTEY
jgi:hypothetical protein